MDFFKTNYFQKFLNSHFEDSESKEKFVEALAKPEPQKMALAWLQQPTNSISSPLPTPFPPWIQVLQERFEGFDQLHENGHFYILDLSSVFAASPLFSMSHAPLILDLCASPGGKGILAWKHLQPSMIIANEMVEKRTRSLIANYKRCKIKTSQVWHLRPQVIAQRFTTSFPLVLVDTPCSGQSLIAKGEKVLGAFQPTTINGNAMRQRRVLSEASQMVSGGGHVLYMTCTYSKDENEDILKWFLKKNPQWKLQKVDHLEKYESRWLENSYRVWPFDGFGVGSFCALLKNNSEDELQDLPWSEIQPIWRNDGP